MNDRYEKLQRPGRPAPRYGDSKPASARSSSAARGASRKSGSKPEILLRRALWRSRLRYRKNVRQLPGKPDLVFPGPRVAVFCDGDFWHGKDFEARKKKLSKGTNAEYWIAKIASNIARDRRHTEQLTQDGWRVMRFWESDILSNCELVVSTIVKTLERQRLSETHSRSTTVRAPRGCESATS